MIKTLKQCQINFMRLIIIVEDNCLQSLHTILTNMSTNSTNAHAKKALCKGFPYSPIRSFSTESLSSFDQSASPQVKQCQFVNLSCNGKKPKAFDLCDSPEVKPCQFVDLSCTQKKPKPKTTIDLCDSPPSLPRSHGMIWAAGKPWPGCC